MYISELETEDDFWDVIATLQDNILHCNDLFISTPPVPLNNQSKNLIKLIKNSLLLSI